MGAVQAERTQDSIQRKLGTLDSSNALAMRDGCRVVALIVKEVYKAQISVNYYIYSLATDPLILPDYIV